MPSEYLDEGIRLDWIRLDEIGFIQIFLQVGREEVTGLSNLREVKVTIGSPIEGKSQPGYVRRLLVLQNP